VLAGAAGKGLLELRELTERGWRDYLSSHGAGFLDNVLSLTFSTCIVGTFVRSCLGYVCPPPLHTLPHTHARAHTPTHTNHAGCEPPACRDHV
jgi:hypothetical protein